MHILLTGGTGFIGSSLVVALTELGHQLTILSRSRHADRGDVRFVRSLGAVQDHVDAVINLAGASLAARRWTPRYKAEIRESRVGTTGELIAWMRTKETPPEVLLSGSAIGFYGASDHAHFDETSANGQGFSAALCRDWEEAALAAGALGTRVVLMRLGVVLDREGGAYVQMARSFSVGVGSWLGAGHQWLSWIHRDDVVGAICLMLTDNSAAGPVNVVAPEAVSHREFCHQLARHRGVFIKAGVPSPVARVLLGEMAEELLLNGQRVLPERLASMGFQFAHPRLADALQTICKKS